MDEIIKLIQQDIPLDTKVIFSLKSGKEVSGVLIEIGRSHVKIERDNKPMTIPSQMIEFWESVNAETKKLPQDPTDEHQIIPPEKLIQPFVRMEPENKVNPDVLKKILGIEARFEAQFQTAKIELKPISFILPKDKFTIRQQNDSTNLWNKITEKYRYAEKMNELHPKFLRIQSIIADLDTLVQRHPEIPDLRRYLAYLHLNMENRAESIKFFIEAALNTQEKEYWYNLAVLALQDKQEELTCYALGQLLYQIPIHEEIQGWYIFTKLVQKFSNYSDLKKLCQKGLLQEEEVLFFETVIYLLKAQGFNDLAHELVAKGLVQTEFEPLIRTALEQFTLLPTESYQRLIAQLTKPEDLFLDNEISVKLTTQLRGYVYKFTRDGYGFLRDAKNSNEYFFHISAVIDEELSEKIQNLGFREEVPVLFELAKDSRKGDGFLAVRISLYQTVDEMINLATRYANNGEYPRALSYIKKIAPSNPKAQELYEKWQEYARQISIPQGTNPYARAKRAREIEGDLDIAVKFYQQAIKNGDNTHSAIMDLASLLDQQNRTQEAIEVLKSNRHKVTRPQAVDNMLANLYPKIGQYDEAIQLWQIKLKHASTSAEKANCLSQIALTLLKQKKYTEAELQLRQVLKIQSDNRGAERNLAICMFKQERFSEAERILNKLIKISPDAKTAQLLEAITHAKTSGQSTQIDQFIAETILSDFTTREISKFAQFFLDKCEFEGVPAKSVQTGKFSGTDVRSLEDLASKLGTKRPRDRANYYLSAAKIVSILDDEGEGNQFYKYLGRSFASRGDATVHEGHLDTAKEFYCEALKIYDGYRNPSSKDEQDALNALIRFLFATLGQSSIPLTPDIPDIDETIKDVFNRHPEPDKLFDAIAYLVTRSRYAGERILNRLYSQEYSARPLALKYLEQRILVPTTSIKSVYEFANLWRELQHKIGDRQRTISNEFNSLVRIDLTTALLEDSIKRVKQLDNLLFFDSDVRRANELLQIFEVALDLCKADTFEEQERLCLQIEVRCQSLLTAIEGNPTRISIEGIYPVIQSLQQKVKIKLDNLYHQSTPSLTMRLAKDMESYTPDNQQQIEIQLVIANKIGCSPAESLELVVRENKNLFELHKFELRLDSSLRGGDEKILRIPLRILPNALREQTFSLLVQAKYRTRTSDVLTTSPENLSIRLYKQADFAEINNPYAAYSEGGIVSDTQMFYGRQTLIENIAKTLQESRTIGKSIIIFGQKRAGKSSILYHLKTQLQFKPHLLILDLGNIGSILDSASPTSLLYQILWGILDKLRYAIEDKVDQGYIPLSLDVPSSHTFYTHSAPLSFFKEVFERYKYLSNKTDKWCDTNIIVLIDEFSYIYGQIIKGKIPDTFMKNWKAILQEGYFSAILVGQDVMPKFKQHFPNEFGTTQDERVTYLKYEEAIKLIDEPIRIGGRQGESRYREQAIKRIFDLTAGSPFYIQIMCYRLVEYMNRKRAKLVTQADVEQVKDELIKGVNALSEDKFDNLISSGDESEDAISHEDILKVLRTIAVNSRTGSCGRNSINCQTKTPVDIILDDLVKRDVLEHDRGYRIRVDLFKEWLIVH